MQCINPRPSFLSSFFGQVKHSFSIIEEHILIHLCDILANARMENTLEHNFQYNNHNQLL